MRHSTICISLLLFSFATYKTLADHHTRNSRQINIIFGNPSEPQSDCRTPTLVPGNCIRIFNCQSLLQQLTSNPSPLFFNILRQSICSFERNIPVVCCPLSSPTTTTPTSTRAPSPTTTTTSTTTTTDVPTTTEIPTTETLPQTNPPIPPTPATNPLLENFASETKCGISNRTLSRIVGGQPAQLGAWPWLAALGYIGRGKTKPEFLCGGALISDSHVLTAAHCVYRRPDLKVVRLGEHNLDTDTETEHQDYQIRQKILHGSYSSSTHSNDIAILVMDRTVTFTDMINVVCLPTLRSFEDDTLAGISGFVTGWGSIAYNNVSSPILKEALVPIVTNEYCDESYISFRSVQVDEKRLCAGTGGTDACQGDSGGPLMVWRQGRYYIAGVVSIGYKCAEDEFPGIYSRVTAYLDWIEENVKTN